MKLRAIEAPSAPPEVQKFLPLKQGLKPRFGCQVLGEAGSCSEVPSIKTRIETGDAMNKKLLESQVQKFLPLKQGLKLNWSIVKNLSKQSSEVPSIKTRIETIIQGLSLCKPSFVQKFLPLKQGLKQLSGRIDAKIAVNGSEVPSIKTRIETYKSGRHPHKKLCKFRSSFH